MSAPAAVLQLPATFTPNDVAIRINSLHSTPVTPSQITAVLEQLKAATTLCIDQLQQAATDKDKESWLGVLYTVFAGIKDDDGSYYSPVFLEHGHTPPPSATLIPAQPTASSPSSFPALPPRKGQQGKKPSAAPPAVAAPVTRYEYRGSAAYVDRFDAQSPSTLLVDLINHAHQQSAYPLLDRIVTHSPTTSSPSPALVMAVVQLLQLHAPHLLSAFSSSFLPPLLSHLLASLTCWSDAQVKSLTKAQVDGLYSSLISVLLSCNFPSLLPSVHSSKLQLSCRLLTADIFDRRLTGMALVNEMLEGSGSSGSAQKQQSSATPSQLIICIRQNELLTLLLTPASSHPELLKRCLPLLSFAVSHSLLSSAHLSLLTEWLSSSHDHELHIVYQLLLELIDILPIPACIALYKALTANLQPANTTTALVRFLYHYSIKLLTKRQYLIDQRRSRPIGERKEPEEAAATAHEEGRMPDGQWLGLSTFWHIFTHSHSHSQQLGDGGGTFVPAVSHYAVASLQAMLKSPLCESQRDYYAAACVDNLQQHNRAPATSLAILLTIIQSFPPLLGRRCEPQHHGSAAEYVLWMEGRWHIVDLIVAGMTAEGVREVKGGVTVKQQNGSNGLSLVLPTPTITTSSHQFNFPPTPTTNTVPASSTSSSTSPPTPATSKLQSHFSFLVQFFRLSTLTLHHHQAKRLWHDHYSYPHSSQSSHSYLLHFFHSLLAHRSKSQAHNMCVCIDDGVCLYVLSDCLSSLPLSSFTPLTFSCFELYFLHVNAQQGLLSSPSPSTMTVNSFSLHGLDVLWWLVMSVKVEEVKVSAMRLLLRVYHARSSIARLGAEGFIKQCLQYMHSPVQPSASFSAAQIYSPKTPHTPSASPLPPHDDDEPPLTPHSPNTTDGAVLAADDQPSAQSPSGAADWEDEGARNERMARCLMLLHSYIQGPTATTSPASQTSNTSSSSGTRADDSMQVILQLKPPGNMKHTLNLPASTTVAALRQQASPLFCHPSTHLDLTGTATSLYNNKPIPDTLPLTSIPSNTQVRSITLTVTRRPLPDSIQPTSSSPADSPAALLSSNLKQYQEVYQLLTTKYPVSLSRPASRLLALLPVNAALFKAVVDQSLKYKVLLPPQSPLQLLHVLSVVDDVLSKQSFESEVVSKKRDEWLMRFVDDGGLAHVRDVWERGVSVDVNGACGWLRCMRVRVLGALMQLMTKVARSTEKARQLVCEPGRYAVITQRIIECIHDASACLSDAELSPSSPADCHLVSNCCVTTIDAAFNYLFLLLSPSTNPDDTATLWSHLYSPAFTTHVFLFTLLQTPFVDVRKALSANVRTLIVDQHTNTPLPNQPPPLVYFTSALLSALSLLSTSSAANTGEYFSLLTALFRTPQLRDSNLLRDGRGEQTIQTLISLIASHPSLETAKHISDDSLCGLLSFTAVLLHFDPALREVANGRLVELLYSDCLFAVDEQHGVWTAKAKYSDTRTQAFQTLMALVLRSQPNMTQLLKLTYAAHSGSKQRERSVWEMESDGMKAHYVGLRNLGNTCYLNAVVQQLVMVPGFSEAMLTIPAVKPARKEGEAEQQPDNSGLKGEQLYDFQTILLPLVLSNAAAIDPTSFIRHFSFFGEPINPLQQMDSQEFLSVFFDRLSTSLSRTTQPHSLQSFFGGKLTNSITPLSCPHRRDRPEPFFILSLNIQHHRDIRGSLSEFVKGETLAGSNAYMCESCGGKVDAVRRSVVSELPAVLWLHLKRFEFDFDAMRKKKLNDECAFPLVLNMRPYMDTQHQQQQDAVDDDSNTTQPSATDTAETKEAAESTSAVDGVGESDKTTNNDAAATDDSDYLYDLVGVVIHSGHAEGGHYWSLVRDRFTLSGSSTSAASSSRWLQFNDQRVSSFNINDLASEAFGGMEDITVDVTAKKDKNGPQTEQLRVEKQRSAYMLVYAKRQRLPVDVSMHVQQAHNQHITGIQRSQSSVAFPSAIPITSLPPYLHAMHANLLRSNLQLLRDHLSFDPPYAIFMLRCHLHAYDTMQRNDQYPPLGVPNPASFPLQLIQSLSLYTLNVATRARHTKRLEQFVGVLAHMVALHVPACFWLLERLAGDGLLLRQLLLEGSGSSRRLVGQLLEIAVSKIILCELDPEYNEKLGIPGIADREKEKQAAEGDWNVSTPTIAPPSAAPSASSSAAASPATSTTASPATSPQPTPSLPPRTLSQSSLLPPTAPTPPPIPPRALPTVDATLAPDGMFKVKGAVSLSSPLTVLNGIGSATAKALTVAGVTTLQLLGGVRERSKKDYSMLMSSTKLSPKQMTDAVEKARAACSFIRMIGGDEPAKPAAAPAPAPAPAAAAVSANGSAADGTSEASQNGNAEQKAASE